MLAFLMGLVALLPFGLVAAAPFLIGLLPATVAVFLLTNAMGQRIVMAIIVIVTLAVGWFVFSTHYYNAGWRAAMHSIAVKDKAALKDADDAENEVTSCYARGGSWNQGAMSCDR